MKTNTKSYTKFIGIIAMPVYLFFTGVFTMQAQSTILTGAGKEAPEIDNFLKLTVVGNGYSDQTIVVFIPAATWGFDPEYDAYKLQGIIQAPQLYSIIPGINLAINALPEIPINLKVQLGFKVGAVNTYTITATEASTFNPPVSILLEDTKDSVLVDLVTNPVYVFSADPADDVERFRLLFRYPVSLDLKVFLEGCFSGTEMNTWLNTSGLIPLNQPYNTEPWNYDGTESVISIPNTDVVDWVLVEIRDTTSAAMATPSTRTERVAGFLMKDGSVRATDGTSYLQFTETVFDSMFVVIWHRNHLGIISSTPVTETTGIYHYDFTDSAGKALGDSLSLTDLGGGNFGMIAGDTDASGIIDESDKSTIWVTEAGNAGYLSSDADLDGQADHPDKNDLWLKNLSSQSQVPQ